MPLAGNEILQVQGLDAQGRPAATQQQTNTAAIAALSPLASSSGVNTALTTGGAGTITAAGIVGRLTTRGGAQGGTPFTDTTDTAANIIAALPAGAAIGTSFQYTYENTTNAPATIAGGTGVTVSGITVVPANSWARYLITFTAAATATMVGFEAGPTSTALVGAQFSAVSGNTPLTLTGAQVGGASDVAINLTAVLAGAGAVTLPTVANLVAAIPNAAAGMAYNLRIINSSSGAFAWTVTTNTGWTLTGTMTIAQNTWRDFVVTLTSTAAAVLQQVGTGTTS